MIGSWLLCPCMRPSSGVGQLKLVQPLSFEAEVFCAHVQNRRTRQYIDVNELIAIVNKDYWNLCKFNNINNYVYNQLKILSYILSLAKNFFECRLYSTFQLHKVYLILKECSLVFYLISNYQLFIFFSTLSRVLKESLHSWLSLKHWRRLISQFFSYDTVGTQSMLNMWVNEYMGSCSPSSLQLQMPPDKFMTPKPQTPLWLFFVPVL